MSSDEDSKQRYSLRPSVFTIVLCVFVLFVLIGISTILWSRQYEESAAILKSLQDKIEHERFLLKQQDSRLYKVQTLLQDATLRNFQLSQQNSYLSQFARQRKFNFTQEIATLDELYETIKSDLEKQEEQVQQSQRMAKALVRRKEYLNQLRKKATGVISKITQSVSVLNQK